MTVAEHIQLVQRAWIARIYEPKRARLIEGIIAKLPVDDLVDLLVAIPSKRQYTRLRGRREENVTTDRRLMRRMGIDRNVVAIRERVKGWPVQIEAIARNIQAEIYVEALLLQGVAYDAAIEADVAMRVTQRDLATARGVFVAGQPLPTLLRAAVKRLADRFRVLPVEVASWVARGKGTMEQGLRRAGAGAVQRFAREVDLVVSDYWFAAVQFAWSRPNAFRVRKR